MAKAGQILEHLSNSSEAPSDHNCLVADKVYFWLSALEISSYNSDVVAVREIHPAAMFARYYWLLPIRFENTTTLEHAAVTDYVRQHFGVQPSTKLSNDVNNYVCKCKYSNPFMEKS